MRTTPVSAYPHRLLMLSVSMSTLLSACGGGGGGGSGGPSDNASSVTTVASSAATANANPPSFTPSPAPSPAPAETGSSAANPINQASLQTPPVPSAQSSTPASVSVNPSGTPTVPSPQPSTPTTPISATTSSPPTASTPAPSAVSAPTPAPVVSTPTPAVPAPSPSPAVASTPTVSTPAPAPAPATAPVSSPVASTPAPAAVSAPAPSPAPSPATLPILQISKLEVAQTHVMPASGLSWTLNGNTTDLHLIGARDALILLDLAASNIINPAVQAWQGSTLLGQVSLLLPSQLGKTEDNGAAYSSSAYSAKLPAAWVKPGVQIRAVASNYQASALQALNVGADTAFTMRILPFYLFGANASNSIAFASAAAPSATVQKELLAKWPLANLDASNHPGQKIQWPSISIGPRNGQAAYLARSKDDQKDGYASMSAVLEILGALREANGESKLAVQYYSPLMMLDSTGVYRHPGGGLGGGSVGTGDASYSGIFIHEAGHAFGLPHQGSAYTSGDYPYPAGSLKGSVWAYDASRNEFLSPLVPKSADFYPVCKTSEPHQLDAQARCIKQDPMQSGAGDQASGYLYATFSDFSTAQMQAYLEQNGYADATFSSGYKIWNASSKSWQTMSKATLDKGIFGLDNRLPASTSVPVHSIIIAYSNAGTPGVSQIYDPLPYTGNLLRNIDPTVKADRDAVIPNTGTYPWLCLNSGCDYTLRVTYADASTHHSLIRQGFRGWYSQANPPASASDPLNSDSFRTWVINVPGSKAIKKIELLSTPKVFNGMPSTDTVLLTRSF